MSRSIEEHPLCGEANDWETALSLDRHRVDENMEVDRGAVMDFVAAGSVIDGT